MDAVPLIFRLDAGERVGIGHWTRCLALSEVIGSTHPHRHPFWFVNPESEPLWSQLLDRSIPFEVGRWDATSVVERVLGLGGGALVVDLMNTQVEWVRRIRRDVDIISVGGSGDGRNHVTVRIDGMIPRPGYADCFQGRRLFMGPEYIILRPGFVNCSKPKPSPVIENVLICLGGDAASQGVQVAEALAELKPDWRIRIMVGSMAQSDSCGLPDTVELYQGITRPWEVMKPVDLAIAAGGMTTFELLHLGIPTWLLPLNEVQRAAAGAFHDAGTAINLGLWDGSGIQLRQKLAWGLLRTNFERRRLLADTGRSLVDGLGLERVAQVIDSQLLSLGK